MSVRVTSSSHSFLGILLYVAWEDVHGVYGHLIFDRHIHSFSFNPIMVWMKITLPNVDIRSNAVTTVDTIQQKRECEAIRMYCLIKF